MDLTRPVALSLIALLHFVTDEDGAHDLVRRLPFGAYADVTQVHASDVLRNRRGDCHSKGVLFTAL